MFKRRGVVLLCWLAAVAAVVAVVAAGALPSGSAGAPDSRHGGHAPTRKSLPTISGVPEVGQVLRGSHGRWTGAVRFAYRWSRCNARGAHCVLISRTARRRTPSSTYSLTGRDAGHAISVTVVATNASGSSYATSRPTTAVRRAARRRGLHVSGDQVLDGGGNVLHLHGVNRSGTEYACIQGWGIFDGPSNNASVAAIRRWNANIVRIPLNEDCWLGINGVPGAYAGRNYRNAIVHYVHLVEHHGMRAELSLMWAAPGTAKATYQPNAPDKDHSPAMWAGMAQTFKNDPNVILAPWGETTVPAECFLKGCNDQAAFASNQDGLRSCRSGCWFYKAAGMQEAVNVLRQNGYHGIISIPGIDFANNMTTWLTHIPRDPQHQLVAEMHLYGKNTCDTTSCLNQTVLPILRAGHPVILGETGETYNDSDAGASYISTFLAWADQHGVGYEPWTWDTWGTYGALISDYSGTPHGNYGNFVKSHFRTLR
jgi:endoglucanase